MRALLAAGWRVEQIVNLTGLGAHTVRQLSGAAVEQVRAETHDRVRAVFEAVEWCPVRPSGVYATRGWSTPAAWDGLDMDDPAARPHTGRPTRRRAA